MSFAIGMELDDLVKDKGYWYLCTPYSKWPHGLEDANQVAQQLTALLMEHRVPVFCPIAHTHGISKFVTQVDKRDFDFWLSADKPLVDSAYGVLVADLTGWRESRGVVQEIGWARDAKKPLWLLSPGTLRFRAL